MHDHRCIHNVKVAFICVHNSCRSQIVEAFGRHLASDVFQSYSAGTETKLQIVPIDGEYVKEAKIGHAIMDADVFISLTHFKGHETAGFECMLSCLPSVTSVGMASLLPHKEMQVDGSLNVTVGVSFLLALLVHSYKL